MSGKEQFIKMPRELLESDAFGSLGISGFRLLRFLMIEHMRRGGRQNGYLKAPYRQLVAFGIGTHQLAAAISEAEEHGLIECHRYGLRVATTYALTWLPLHDGTAASNQWRDYRPEPKAPKKLPVDQQAVLHVKQQADRPNLHVKQQAEPSGNLPVNQQALYRSSYQGGGSTKEETYRGEATAAGSGADAEAVVTAPPGKPHAGEVVEPALDPTRRCGRYVTNGVGHRICGKPVLVGTENCPDHSPSKWFNGHSVTSYEGRP
jgi:hypothetical protein